jgi:ADP-heptose:LPS heptosyltransferase
MTIERILLIQLFSNGDCLYVTAIARQIKKNHPGSYLTWIVSSKCSSMLLNNPDIDEILEVAIPNASQNEIIFNQILSEANEKKRFGLYSKIIVPQLIGNNMKYYDGLVYSSLYRSAGFEQIDDPTPKLYLTQNEYQIAKEFAQQNQLHLYKHVILFECAPQSNQLLLTDELIKEYARCIVNQGSACVILSSPKAYRFNEPHIFDGNRLSIRETVALTHYCTLLLGCSSGISWAANSNAAKSLNFVQILSKQAYYFNPLSLTLEKWHYSSNRILELIEFNTHKIEQVFQDIFTKDFQSARINHHQKVQISFKLHRGIIHHFLKNRNISELITFISINIKENGFNFYMIRSILLGFILFPFQFVYDAIRRN